MSTHILNSAGARPDVATSGTPSGGLWISAVDGDAPWVGTAAIEVSLDGENWTTSAASPLAADEYKTIPELATFVRLNVTAYTSGELVCTLVKRGAFVSRAAAGGPPVLPTQFVQYPESTAWEIGIGEARRGWLGGSLSRSWIAVTRDGTTYVPHIRHNGAGANPVPWVASLAGATPVEVTLSSGNQTGADVAAAVAAALVLAGLTDVTSTDDVVEIPNATVTYPPAVDTTDRARTGMYGYQRETAGGAEIIDSNNNGGSNATTLTHIPAMVNEAQGDFPAARNGRILGVYFWGHGSGQPLLGAGRGPTHAEAIAGDPIEILGEGVTITAAATDGAFSYTLFDEPVAFTTEDELWGIVRVGATGGPRYRLHSSSALPGDLDPTQELTIADLTTSPADPFDNSGTGAGTYTPVIDNTYAIDMTVGVLYELEDDNGNYHADGSIDDWHGDQNTDPDHGTQFQAGPALLDTETTWHRHGLYGADVWPVVAVRRVYGDTAADEDSRMGFYGFFDLDYPSTTPAELLSDAGLVGLTAGTGNRMFTTTITEVDVGEAARASSYVAFGTNYVTVSGDPLVTMVLPVFLSDPGTSTFIDCWVDNGRRWHDDIPEANQHALNAGVSEYRTHSTLPYQATSEALPDPMPTDGADDSPSAIANEAYHQQRAGVAAA